STGRLMYHKEIREQVYNQTLQGILSITGDSIQGAWDGCGGITQPYLFNWVVSTSCPIERFPYKVHVGGKPTFSLDKDPASEATYKSGTLSDPDLLCMN